MGSESMWIGLCLFIIGVMINLSLEFNVEKLINFFKKYPKGYEICIQLMLAAMPLGLAINILPNWNSGTAIEIQGILIVLAVVWPFVIYIMHGNINRHAIELGITSKQAGITDPILSARLNILGWTISGLLILYAFYAMQFSSLSMLILPLFTLGFLGIVSFQLFESIFTLLRKPVDAEESQQNISEL